jgi:dolichol-phosphate mannosyltransferase
MARRQTLPVRFAAFAVVGATGAAVHLVTVWVAVRLGVSFFTAHGDAVVVAMTWNFFVNNAFTYAEQRLRGATALLRGLASFYAVGALGAVVNVAVASIVYIRGGSWWFAALAGAATAMVWNFTMSGLFTWRRRDAIG